MVPDRPDIALHLPFLRRLASQKATILELGCENGNGSTRALSLGLAESQKEGKCMVSVDINPFFPDLVMPMWPWWRKVNGDTRNWLTVDAARDICPAFDLIFIDTDHNYEQMRQELGMWFLVATKKTEWLFHDTWMMGSYNPMTDAIKEFAALYGMVYKDLSRESHGLGWMGVDISREGC